MAKVRIVKKERIVNGEVVHSWYVIQEKVFSFFSFLSWIPLWQDVSITFTSEEDAKKNIWKFVATERKKIIEEY